MSISVSLQAWKRRFSKSVAFTGLMAIVCLLTLQTGCQREKADKSLLIAGSSTVLPFSKLLGDAFAAKHPGMNIVCDGGGSTAGLLAVRTGAIDVATLSRDMSRTEESDTIRNYILAKNAIAIVVHPANPLRNMTVREVKDIFSGELKNWSAVGGADKPITVLSRKSSSTTRRGLEEAAMEGEDFVKDAKQLENGKMMVQEVSKNPLAIGYVALPDLTEAVKVLTIDNVELHRETILSGRYPLSRTYYLAISQTATPWARRFVEFAISNEGQTLLEKEHLVRVY